MNFHPAKARVDCKHGLDQPQGMFLLHSITPVLKQAKRSSSTGAPQPLLSAFISRHAFPVFFSFILFRNSFLESLC